MAHSKSMRLDASVYPRAAVDDAVEAFSDAGKFKVQTVSGFHKVSVRPANGLAPDEVLLELGNYALARQALDLGLHLSFTGVITFPKAGPLREVLKKVPIERIFLETDCPYLSPVPFRGKRNEPARVVQVAQTVAEVLGRSIDEIARITTGNVVRLFRLPNDLLEGVHLRSSLVPRQPPEP